MNQTASSLTGDFAFTELPAGEYELIAEHSVDGGSQRKSLRVTVEPSRATIAEDFRFSADQVVAGVVTDPDGLPVVGAYIMMFPQSAQLEKIAAKTATRQDGAFHLHDVPPGRYRICVQVPEPMRAESGRDLPAGTVFEDISTGQGLLDLKLPRVEKISGYVVDAAENPVPGAFVLADLRGLIIDVTQADQDGRFSLHVGDTITLSAHLVDVQDSPGGPVELPDSRTGRKQTVFAVAPGTRNLIVRLPCLQ